MSEETNRPRKVSFAKENSIQHVYSDDESTGVNLKEIDMELTQDLGAFVSSAPQNFVVNENLFNINLGFDKQAEKTLKEVKRLSVECRRNSLKKNEGRRFTNNDDLINTVDLKKIIQKERKEDIYEFLAIYGNIRFMDKYVEGSGRRDTMSKSKNVVEEDKIDYYKNFTSEMFNFYDNFTLEINEKLNELDEKIFAVEEEVDISKLKEVSGLSNKLKGLKMESRRRAEVSWNKMYNEKQIDLNKALQDKRDNLRGIVEKIKNSIITEGSRLETLKSDISEFKAKIEEVKEKNIKFSDNNKFDKNNYDKCFMEQKAMLEKIIEDVNEKNRKEKSLKEKLDALKTERAEIMDEITKLKINLKDNNYTAESVDKLKSDFINSSAIFNIHLKKIKDSIIHIKILNYDLRYDSIEKSFEIKAEGEDFIRNMLLNLILTKIEGKNLKEILKLLFRAENIATLVKILEEKTDIEYQTTDEEVDVRISNDTELGFDNKNIKITFDKLNNEEAYYDLLKLI